MIFLYQNHAVRLGHGLQDAVVIDRRQRREVDDLATHPVAFQLLGGLQSLYRHRTPGHHGDVGSLTESIADIQQHCLTLVGDFLTGQPIQPDGLEKDDRIRIPDRRQQQTIRTGRRGGANDAQARVVRQHRLHAFGVMFRGVDAAAVRHA